MLPIVEHVTVHVYAIEAQPHGLAKPRFRHVDFAAVPAICILVQGMMVLNEKIVGKIDLAPMSFRSIRQAASIGQLCEFPAIIEQSLHDRFTLQALTTIIW